MRLYLAGPMTGYPEHNIPAFLVMGAALRSRGLQVVIPCEGVEQEERTWEEWMARDIAMMMQCDGVAVLEGWEASRGASLEVFINDQLARPTFDAKLLAEGWSSDSARIMPTPEPAGLGRRSLESVMAECTAWADETFPAATLHSRAVHLHREAAELLADPTDAEEMADVLMLLGHLASHAGVNLTEALTAKLAKNRRRTWGQPDADGVVEHVREEVLP